MVKLELMVDLYGWAMSQFWPTGDFRWMSQKEINKTNLAVYKDGSGKGSTVDVDLNILQNYMTPSSYVSAKYSMS